MALYGNPNLTGQERFFDTDEVIVSKTDLAGKMTYVNRTFMKLAGLSEKESLGQPHNIIRHPEMPRCVFELLWNTLKDGNEIFAYVNNRSINGDNYWVLAHVTPSRNAQGEIIGYHSNRRVPDRGVLDNHIIPLYRDLLAIEKADPSPKSGMQTSYNKVVSLLEENKVGFNELMFSLGGMS